MLQQLSETFAVETELADDDGMFVEVRGFGVVHLGVSLDKLVVSFFKQRSDGLPQAELSIPHESFGRGDAQLQTYKPTATNLLQIPSGRRLAEEAIRLIDQCYGVFTSSTITWEQKFDLIFAKLGVVRAMRELGFALDYYDPDTSCEEDVKAVMEALQKKRGELVTFATVLDQPPIE